MNLVESMISDHRFWSKVAIGAENECWPWLRGRNRKKNGVLTYGLYTYQGRGYPAHRYIYWKLNGDIPEGLIVRHRCDNPPCCNPDHLEVGTYLDNSNDCTERNRRWRPTHCVHGHLLSGDNLYKDKYRHCRTCALERKREWSRRNPKAGVPLLPVYQPESGRMKNARAAGERNHFAKLTEEKVEALRNSRAQGTKIKDIAAKFGIHFTTVHRILRGQLWR